MELRLADKKDLADLKIMFEKIVEHMHKQGVNIWNEFYPYEEFENDIENKNLYVIDNNKDIVAVFGVFDSVEGQEFLGWQDKNAKAMYLGRVGVNVDYLKQGIGSLIIKYSLELAEKQKADFVRLLVVDINKPAINLYLKNGFVQACGIYNEYIKEEDLNLTLYGFEKRVK